MSRMKSPRPHHRPATLRVLAPFELPADFAILPGVPATRGDCRGGPRPCGYLSCRHHLWLSLQQEQAGNPQRGRQGATRFRPSTMESCALDVADSGQVLPLRAVGELLGIQESRVEQILDGALEKLGALGVELLGEREPIARAK